MGFVRPSDIHHFSDDELEKAADKVRAVIAADKSPRAAAFRKRFARLFHGYPSGDAKPFAPLYRTAKLARPTICNLIYHACPLVTNDLWRKNVAQLKRRLSIFNGRKVVAIATGKGCESPAVVRKEFPGCEVLELPNDPELREVATFLPLLLSVADPDPQQATFYGHTKGNSTAENIQGSIYWRNAAYHHLLDRAADCLEELETHACCGIHKMIWTDSGHGTPYPSGLNHGGWTLAGTFMWFRNDRIFSHPRWRHVPADRYGAEAWLSGLFHWMEAASVFQLWPESLYPTPSPYDPAIYPDPIDD